MKMYLKERYKYYISITSGLLIGFIVVIFLLDKPDYKSGIVAILFGLIIGELLFYSRWSIRQKRYEIFKQMGAIRT
ncbi:hypothetical protein CSV75_09535 [Sporosarcina sp. P18a]|uniref:hypothetical protein n=1 Tax=Sporosarcina sp. P18a TaxID=2048259 RepID=UPI000C16525B|nr:hypothetical protein [Sporosarcina sp. P18a]PIC80190.1 hypothetical protein CSV75_09535 [Sporosarcina sp. P18a]